MLALFWAPPLMPRRKPRRNRVIPLAPPRSRSRDRLVLPFHVFLSSLLFHRVLNLESAAHYLVAVCFLFSYPGRLPLPERSRSDSILDLSGTRFFLPRGVDRADGRALQLCGASCLFA